MSVIIAGYLEIDQERGVIYFHSSSTGHTPLRICSLPQPVPNPSEYGVSLDITHMQGCSWGVIGIDLSKVEARLINNIRSHDDPYIKEASKEFGVPYEKVTIEMRQVVKKRKYFTKYRGRE